MGACKLAVTIDGWNADGDWEPTFRPGEVVTGTVHVWVSREVRCEGLDVGFEQRPTQRGYTLPKHPACTRVFSGRWTPGEYDYRFELRAPDLPTREGALVGWRWLVTANAEIPFAKDPQGEAGLRVAPSSPTPPPLVVRPAPSGEETDDPREQGDLLWGTGVLLALSLGIAAVGFGLEAFGVVGSTLGAVITWVGLGGAALSAIYGVKDWLALRRLRRRPSVEVRWDGPADGAGEESAGGRLRCDVRTPFEEVERLRARLVLREQIRWREQRPATDQYRIHEDEATHPLAEIALRRDERTGRWTGDLPIPPTGSELPPCSLRDDRGRGLWWHLQLSTHRTGEREPVVDEVPLSVERSPET
ncbi:MAG TPA: hypothetical protein RMH99_06035 [Sandaracinaceae bacterium LLY-WYZ-13_1]|nr:hypothetical protein [Sandaracinaceae bacterium LLY-WYZ-13_1]